MIEATQAFAKKLYESKEWRRLRKEVLIEDKYECLHCKAKGKYEKANTVHHVNYLKLHPELALEKFYTDDDGNVKRNLVSVCHLILTVPYLYHLSIVNDSSFSFCTHL